MQIAYEPNFPQSSAQEVSEELFLWNCQQVGLQDFQNLPIILRNSDGVRIGALLGWTRWQWAHIDTFFIHPDYRNQGYGKQMIAEFERIAQERGCHIIDLDTFSFQAPAFYQKMGYTFYGKLEGIGQGVQRFFLKKQLLLNP